MKFERNGNRRRLVALYVSDDREAPQTRVLSPWRLTVPGASKSVTATACIRLPFRTIASSVQNTLLGSEKWDIS